ncbi:Sterol O-acyltransferase 2 [Camponotus japonicus]
MKNHAFVRSVTSRFLSYKPHNDVSPPNVPRFSHYLYFLFAPTIIYRDEYPRTKKIRWMFVVQHFAEVVLVIFYYTFILEAMCRRFERLALSGASLSNLRHMASGTDSTVVQDYY